MAVDREGEREIEGYLPGNSKNKQTNKYTNKQMNYHIMHHSLLITMFDFGSLPMYIIQTQSIYTVLPRLHAYTM